MGRFVCCASVILAMAAVLPAAQDPFNIDFRIGWDGCYRPMEWTPVEIDIVSKLKDPFEGRAVITGQQDSLTTMTTRSQRFVVTQDLPQPLPMVIKLAYGASTCELAIVDNNDRKKWSQDFGMSSMYGTRLMTPVGDNDLLIGLVGRRGLGLTRLGEHTICRTSRETGKVYVKEKLPKLLPWDWTGLASLDLLVLYSPDWEAINVHQAKAISDWVSNGGRLLIVLGGNVMPSANPIAKLVPFEIGQPVEAKVPAQTIEAWGYDGRGGSITFRSLAAAASKGWSVESLGLPEPVFAEGLVKFGRVAVLSCDPAALGAQSAERIASFWAARASALLDERKIEFTNERVSAPDYPFYGSHRLGESYAATNVVLNHLLSIPELRPLSIWWVIALLATLALLLGPIDYLVLKRLDRLPLTWVTSTAIILLFTVGAYYGVQALRAGEMQVRAVSLIDGIEGAQPWSTSYCGIFAPASDKYLLEGTTANQWWSAIAPTENENVYYYRGSEMTSRKIYCLQQDGGNLPEAIPINIWSMQCLINESPAPLMPILADVQSDAARIALRITNRVKCPIRRGWVQVGGRRMTFGPVGPGETGEFSGPASAGSGDEYHDGDGPVTAAILSSVGCSQRTRAVESYLRRGAAVVCAEYDEAPLSYSVANNRSNVNHIQLVRLVVFPRPFGK